MTVKIKFFYLTVLFTLLQSCQLENTPEEYFDRTALNTNILMGFGARDFTTMEQNRNAGQLLAYDDNGTFPAKSYEDHILRFKMPYIDQSIEKIKELKPTDETSEMIQASLDLFEFVKEKYKTDYLKIATLMEKKAPREEIDKALTQMEQTTFPVFDKKYKKLWNLAMPYAKKHGIEVQTF